MVRVGLEADPPIPPPTGLRRVLSFARPSSPAWATVRRVVDGDDELRERVAAATTEDAVGQPSWLFLTRPDGWEAELAELAGRASARPAAGTPGEVAALRRKLTGAEHAAQRHEEAADAARAAEEAVRARLDEQQPRIDELERQVTELTEALDAAAEDRRAVIRNLKTTQAELEAARGALRAAEDARRAAEATVEALQRSAHEAEPAADVPPDDVPSADVPSNDVPPDDVPSDDVPPDDGRSGADVDLDALRAAVREAGSAAAALGAALHAAASVLDPVDDPGQGSSSGRVPDTGDERDPAAWEASGRPRRSPRRRSRRPARLPGGVFEESTEAVDHLLRLPDVIVVVDGYNVAKTAWDDLGPEEERRRLVQLLERAHLRTRAEFLVVFDGVGDPGAPPGQAQSRTVRVRFSPAGVTADDVVRGLVDELPLGRPVVVVSSDREVADGARARGANVVGSRQLVDAVR